MRKPITLAILAAIAGLGEVFAGSPVNPPTFKVMAPHGTFAGQSGVELIEDYGSVALYRVDAAARAKAGDAAQGDVDVDRLLFSAYPFDTQRETLTAPAPFTLASAHAPGLHMLQFVGPIKQEWLDTLVAAGITPVHYVASNGYLVWIDAAAQAALANLAQDRSWLQFSSPLHGFLKLSPSLSGRVQANPVGGEEIDVTVQIYRHRGDGATRAFIAERGVLPSAQQAPLGAGRLQLQWTPVLAYENVEVRLRLADLAAIAERADVAFIGENVPMRMMDEKQGLIMSGVMTPGPSSMDYLQFLLQRGFSQNPADYPIVDMSDSPVHEGGTGDTVLNTTDPMLRVAGNINNPSRVVSFTNCSGRPDSAVGGIDGHGALNAGIAIGYDQTSGWPHRDADGHQLGLGINPFGRLGSTAIFSPNYDLSGCGNSYPGLIQANARSGAKISNNSWGASIPPTTYDAADQFYDVGVRNADPDTPGDQSMIYVFAAANTGPGAATVSSPGAGKNVITVGASENLRPQWTDGCGMKPSDADNAHDVVSFSGRGPAPGQRVKPEVIGPGTHIQAAASTYFEYTGARACDMYYPPAQTIFAASSGTSHSAPAVAGVASLSYWWIEQGGAGAAAGTLFNPEGARAPSPAMMKAWLMAHPTYLTGVSANDALPSNSQGYGMPNMSLLFDAVPKVLIDQTHVFDNTGESWQMKLNVADPSKPVRIALAYTDAPGQLGTSPQVNNLNLRAVNAGRLFLGNRFDHQWSITGGSADTKNNYEGVFLPAGTSGEVNVSVLASNIAGDGVPGVGDGTDQDFALVCYNCLPDPSFTLVAATTAASVCAGEEFSAPISVGQINRFADPVALSVSGAPTGSAATVTPNTLTPPSSTVLKVASSSNVPAGSYTTSVTGTSGAITKKVDFHLDYFRAAPDPTALQSPLDHAVDLPVAPTFAWAARSHVEAYRLEIARDPGFATIVLAQDVPADRTSYTLEQPLQTGLRFYWRISDVNACGASAPSPSYTFTTAPAPGDCPIETTPVSLFSDDVETGVNGWTAAATVGPDNWSISTTRAHSPSHAWWVKDPPTISDQTLTSPSIDLPAALQAMTMEFHHWRDIDTDGGYNCWDGAILEVSLDGGAFSQVPDAQLLTDPYTAMVPTSYANPIGGQRAWCGVKPYTRSVVDLAAYSGHRAQFRFRLASDNEVGKQGWYVDDISVKGCAIQGPAVDEIFADGFEP